MKRIRFITIGISVFLLFFFLNSFCNAQKDFSITVEDGSFAFKNLSITPDYRSQAIKGEVTNFTNRDWGKVIFEVEAYDAAGKSLGRTSDLILYRFKRGETQSADRTFLIEAPVISRWEYRFKAGEYPAKYNFVLTKPKASSQLIYEDPFLIIEFSITRKQFGFILQNRTENPIKIDWNQVSYVDVLSESHKVIHSGVKYTDKGNPQTPTLIPPTAKLKDIVYPIDYVSYLPGPSGGLWKEEPLFPEAPEAKNLKGKSFGVFMPLEINGVIKNYLFSFNIADVES